MTKYEETVKSIADRLGLTIEEIGNDCENIIINNTAFENKFSDYTSLEFPKGWCNKTRWDKYITTHPNYNEPSWIKLLDQNLDFLLENNALDLG